MAGALGLSELHRRKHHILAKNSISASSVLLVTGLIGFSATAANATPLIPTTGSSAVTSSETSEQIAALVDRVAPNLGTIVPAEADLDAATKNASSALDPTTPIRVAAGDAAPLEVGLPVGLGLGIGERTSYGTTVYQSGDPNGVYAAVQNFSNGSTRVATNLKSSTAAHEFTYTIPSGFQPVRGADGSIWVVGFDTAGAYQAFSVDEAWARDANGNAVTTSYEIRGTNLIQTVTPPEKTVYPIVADPTWQWYSAAYGAGFSKAETRGMVSVGAVAGLCRYVPKGPLEVACAAAGAYWFVQAGLAAAADECIFLGTVPPGVAFRWISPECK